MAQTTSFVEGSYDPFTVVPVKEKRDEELAAKADLGLTLGVVANAKGSAYVDWNEAKLVAAVFGMPFTEGASKCCQKDKRKSCVKTNCNMLHTDSSDDRLGLQWLYTMLDTHQLGKQTSQ